MSGTFGSPATDLHPDAARLLDRMTGPPPDHDRFVGTQIDLTDVDPLVLGDVWSVAEAIDHREMYRPERSFAGTTAEAIVALRCHDVPAFRGSACCNCLDLIAAEAEASKHRARYDVQALQKRICFVLARCTDLSFGGLRVSAERVLSLCPWVEIPHLALALGRIAERPGSTRVLEVLAADLAGSPFLVDELRLAAVLSKEAAVVLADFVDADWRRQVPDIGAPRYRLSDVPGYADFANAIARKAAERVQAIHGGATPYEADKAFTPLEAKVVGRSLRVGLDRDEAWVSAILESLFLKVSVAPTPAKTMPSQAVAIALGQAVEAFPTPEAVVILRKVLREIRHAGVEKKLQRNLRGAEKALAGRVEIALRLPRGEPVKKAELTTLTRALEATFGAPQPLTFGTWHSRLAGHPSGRGIAAALVWRIAGPSTNDAVVLPIDEGGGLRLETVSGAAIAPDPDCEIALWHPADATEDERAAWRDLVVARRIRQPFKQVFREHYAISEQDLSDNLSSMFAGHAVSLRPFLGLARREGWRADGSNRIMRSVDRWRVTFVLADEVAPGATGWTTTGLVGIWSTGEPRWVPAPFRDLSPVVLSEILRSVDLLVSTSGFATTIEPGPTVEEPLRRAHLKTLGDSPLGPMAAMRRQAIRHVLAGRADMDRLQFGPRHLRLEPYAIHLATGRVTRHGDPVTIDLPERSSLAAVPWLPYDEKLMETIVYTTIEIARICDAER